MTNTNESKWREIFAYTTKIKSALSNQPHYVAFDIEQEGTIKFIEFCALAELKAELDATEKVYRMNREYVETAKERLALSTVRINELTEKLRVAKEFIRDLEPSVLPEGNRLRRQQILKMEDGNE